MSVLELTFENLRKTQHRALSNGGWVIKEDEEDYFVHQRESDGLENHYNYNDNLLVRMLKHLPDSHIAYHYKIIDKNGEVLEDSLNYVYSVNDIPYSIEAKINRNSKRIFVLTTKKLLYRYKQVQNYRIGLSDFDEKIEKIEEMFLEELKNLNEFRFYFLFH